MLMPGAARKVTVHLNDDTSNERGFIHEQVFDFLLKAGVSGATFLRPEAGFGEHHHRHSQEGHGQERRHLPVQIQFVEEAGVVDALLPALYQIVEDGMIEMQDTIVLKVARQENTY